MHFQSLSLSWAFVATITVYADTVSARFPITGVKTGVDATTGYRPPRRNIIDLMTDEAQFSLYIQAMNSLMAVNETNLTSFFQVAGIHGRPFVAWDDVNPKQMLVDGIPIGYCTHGNTLFGTWHRPYLALIEQVMAGHAQTVAKAYNSPSWQTAADNLRFPYWDWAAPPQSFPEIMTWPTVRITTATGPQNVTNPLYRYKFTTQPEPEIWFPRNEGEGDAYLADQPWTLRWPDNQNITHNEIVKAQFFPEIQNMLRSQVYSVFAQTSDFNSMSTNGNGGPNFENPHNNIHGYVGGTNGHMSPLTFSGFEPAFWLHHANVDRQIAMWQAIYPDAWLTPASSPGGTWTIFPGTTVDANTPLTPFTTGDGSTLYTSETARYTKYFGYSYPEVRDWALSKDDLAREVTAAVNKLYNPEAANASKRIRGSSLEKRADSREWILSAQIPNEALDTGFSIKFSFGTEFVGQLSILSAPTKVEVDSGAKRVSHAQFSLVDALGDVDPTDIAAVVARLKGKLTWAVVKTDGSAVKDVKGLEVEVVDVVVKPAGSVSEFPKYGERTAHPEIIA